MGHKARTLRRAAITLATIGTMFVFATPAEAATTTLGPLNTVAACRHQMNARPGWNVTVTYAVPFAPLQCQATRSMFGTVWTTTAPLDVQAGCRWQYQRPTAVQSPARVNPPICLDIS